MPKQSQRQRRYAGYLRRILATIILDDSISGVHPGCIAIHDIIVSGDLRHAKIFVFPVGLKTNQAELDEKDISQIKTLNEHTSRIQLSLNEHLRSKYTPKISFHLDTAFQQATRLDQIIHKAQAQET